MNLPIVSVYVTSFKAVSNQWNGTMDWKMEWTLDWKMEHAMEQ